MLTPLSPGMTYQYGTEEYQGCIYFDPHRSPFIMTQDKEKRWSNKLKTAVHAGDVIVPVRVYEWKGEHCEFWHKPKKERVLVRDYFPKWLPLKVLLPGREGRIVSVQVTPINPHQSVSYDLLCTQGSIDEGAVFEMWYRDPKRAAVFNYDQYRIDYLNRTVPTISRSVARPHFETVQTNGKAKISLKPRVEADEQKGCTEFMIRVCEDGHFEDIPVNPEVLKKYSPFFRRALNSDAFRPKEGATGIFEINSSIHLMQELIYFLTHHSFKEEITINTLLGLISLNSLFGFEQQNLEFEQECLDAIEAKISEESCQRVFEYARDNHHVGLVKILEEFLQKTKLNLIGLNICSAQDCITLFQQVPSLAELIAIGIREELILRGNPVLWKEVFEISKQYREQRLFEELFQICQALAKKNPDVKAAWIEH
ncbi:MAG: hypothetical protein JSS30_00150 [Verrucomicrobia bacterium]|nr:hypothetical protein [Verrucomicrobiota bacterium]